MLEKQLNYKAYPNSCKWFPVCPMKYFYEAGKLDSKWIKNFCMQNYQQCVRFQKEEAGVYHSDDMLPDGSIDNNLKY